MTNKTEKTSRRRQGQMRVLLVAIVTAALLLTGNGASVTQSSIKITKTDKENVLTSLV